MTDIPNLCLICGDGGSLIHSKRIDAIRRASEERGDNLASTIESGAEFVLCHVNCLSTYCSKHHVARHLKRLTQYKSSCEQPTKRLRCSEERFEFKQHCIFCGKPCVVIPDQRHPSRWQEAYLCRTADRRGKESFKNAILRRVQQRNDKWGIDVAMRVNSALSDLHAADGRYHKDCHSRFFTNKICGSEQQDKDEALEKLITEMKCDKNKIWNSIDCYKKYQENGGSILQRRNLVNVLSSSLPEIVVLSAAGVASVLVFRVKAATVLRLVEDNNDDNDALAIKTVASLIKQECKSLEVDTRNYSVDISIDSSMSLVSPSLATLLMQVSSKLNGTQTAALVGSIVTSVVKCTATPLQIALAVALNQQKHLITLFHDYGVTCSYDELRRFRASAAVMTERKHASRGMVGVAERGLVQVVADNFDVNLSTQNGIKQTHGLAMIVTQMQLHSSVTLTGESSEVIPKLNWQKMKDIKPPAINIQRFQGPTNPNMPVHIAQRLWADKIQTLRQLSGDVVTQIRRRSVAIDDCMFFKEVLIGAPEYHGWNMCKARERHCEVKLKTRVAFIPLLDMIPSEPDTMKTAMVEAIRISKAAGQEWTIFTNDQQLYRVAVQLSWADNDLFQCVVLRLGGMHLLMSYIGCVGTLMAGSGLEDILKSAFAGVSKMLTGHKYPQNLRALRLLVEELLRPLLQDSNYTSMDDVELYLDDKSKASNTCKLWVECLIKPVFIMMAYVRAERESDWLLHLWAVKSMMPLFFAAGHMHYARYGLYYMRCMEKLSPDIFSRFMKGEHTVHQRSGLWNGIWTDQLIESTYMRFGKGPQGVVGFTLKPATMNVWALSLHVFGQVRNSIEDMSNDNYSKDVVCHKEETTGRITSDKADREKIKDRLTTCIDVFDVCSHKDMFLMNIVTGEIIEDERVNVFDSTLIGTRQSETFQKSWPAGFYRTLEKKVTTIAKVTSAIRLSKKKHPVTIDHSLIYARAMGLLTSSRDINIDDLFMYELAPVPAALFSADGEMRQTQKSVLKLKLAVNISARVSSTPEIVIMDACAMLWCVSWPSSPAVVADFVKVFTSMVKHSLKDCHTLHIVFDRYHPGSIKTATRTKRQGNVSRQHQLSKCTPLPKRELILNSSHNKAQLIKIIYDELQSVHVDEQHKLILTGPQPAAIEVGVGTWGPVTTHEEADVSMVFIAITEATLHPNFHIRIVCDDTDVLTLLAYHIHASNIKTQISMQACSGERSVICLNDVVERHGNVMGNILGAHALTGCDTTSALAGIGKTRMFNVLTKFKGSLTAIGDQNVLNEQVFQQCDVFVAALYSKGALTMNGLRCSIWKKKMAQKKITNVPQLSKLPPTESALHQHYLRAHLQTAYWKAASGPDAPFMDPCAFGWELSPVTKTIIPRKVPYGTLLLPDVIQNLISCSCTVSCGASCGCRKKSLPCTTFCDCESNCVNCPTDINCDSSEDSVPPDDGEDDEDEDHL